MLIDSHCHLDFATFDSDRQAVIERCLQSNINHIVIPGVMASTWLSLLKLCAPSPHLWPALGMHPMFMSSHQQADIMTLQTLATAHDIVAIGEIGLDFFVPDHDKTQQIALFTAQLSLAQTLNLPVILHVRKAHDVVIELLKQYSLPGGIVHAFSGSQQQAQRYIDAGFLLGVGGVITYPNAVRLRQLFTALPLSSIALETDAPDMPLHGQQGQRNSPESIAILHQLLSTLRPESSADIAEQTSLNVTRLFSL